MKKRLLAFVLCLAMVLTLMPAMSFTASAAETSGDYDYVVLDDGTAEITGYHGAGGSITIPATLDGYTVTSIGDWSFNSNTDITAVTITKGVKRIGNRAFLLCSNLTSVTIPNSVTAIGDDAFRGTGLKSLVIPGSVETIGFESFFMCTNLQSLTLSEGIKSIGSMAFAYNPQITRVVIPNSVTSLESSVFTHCSGLTAATIGTGVAAIPDGLFDGTALTGITIPSNVITIGTYAFRNCKNLKSVTIPDTVKSLGDGVFAGCTALASVSFGKGLTDTGTNTFSGTALTSVTIPDNITSIGAGAFNGIKLTAIALPSGIKTIGASAFRGTLISNVELPNGLESIGDHAFFNCENMKSVDVPGSVTSIGSVAFGYYNDTWEYKYDDFIVYGRLKSAAEQYAAEAPRGGLTFVVMENGYEHRLLEDDTVEIVKYHGSETALNVPAELSGLPVTKIGEEAFRESNIKSVTISEGIRNVGKLAFYKCTSLTSISLPNGLKSIGNVAFYGCPNLKSVTVPPSVISIGDKTFGYAGGETSHVSGFSMTGYYGTAAENYAKKENFTFNALSPYEVKVLDEYSIEIDGYRGSETSLVLPNHIIGYTVRAIGDNAFKDKPITSIDIPIVVRSVGKDVLSGCTSLRRITMPESAAKAVADDLMAISPEWYNSPCGNKLTSADAIKEITDYSTLGWTPSDISDYVIGHDYDAQYIVKEATETEPAEYHAVCRRCGETTDSYIPEGLPESAALTDIKRGDFLKQGTTFNNNYGSAISHNNCTVYINGERVATVGYEKQWTAPECLVCTEVVRSNFVGHDIYFESGCDYLNATCTAPKTCIYCGATEGEALGHTWADATCTTPKTCTVCGEIADPTLGHDWIAATCTEPKTCSLCGATEGEALGHSFTARGALVSEADCTHSAVYVAKCSRCDETNGTFEVGSPLGHDYDAQYIVKEATETTPAEYHAVCRRCGDVTDNYIPKKASDSVTLTDIKVGDILKRGATFDHDYGNVLANSRCHIYVNGAKVASVDYKKQWTAQECLICTKIEKNRIAGSDVYFESYCDYTKPCTHPATCVYCGDTKGDALGHTFENGVCTVCGFAQFKFDSISLVLSGELGLNFYTKVNDIESVKDGYMLFEIGNKGKEQKVNFSNAVLCDDGRYVFTCNVNALQMADTITVSFHYGDTVVGPRTTSVAGYIDKVIENHKGNDSDRTVKLAKSIVNYGHYAQLGQQEVRDFVIGEDYAAINNLSDVAIVDADNLAQHKVTKTGSVDGITKVTRSLSLDHGTDINIYFTVADDYVPTVTVTDEYDNSVDFTLEKRADGRYQLVIPQISAHKLGDMYTVTVDGEMTINVSALSYAYSVLSSDKSDAQKLCVSALYKYYIAAIAYQNGYSFGEWVAEIPATCTENGVKGHYFCSLCKWNFDADGKVIADLTIPALGHSFSDEWTYDGIGHWHKATCEHTDLKSDYANHTFGEAYTGEDGHEYIKCSECGFVGIMSTHGLAFEYDSRKDGYICTGIGTAETTDIVIGYLYNDGYKPIIGVGDRAFEKNWDLTSVVLSDTVTTISFCAFENCIMLNSVVLSDNLTVIGDSAFADCRSLSSISFPSKLTTIGSHAFYGCNKLRDVVLPDSLTNIGSRPFDNHLIRCNMYDGGYYLGSESNPYFALIDADKNITDFVIADGTKILSGNVFYNYGNISSMVVPSSVKTICSSAIRIISVDKVFYKGTEAEWETIVVERYNDDLMNAPRYYYSETQPTTEGYFWHYENNVPTIW